MNDKIKEILDNIKNKYDGYLVCDIVSGDDLKLLLDYINKIQSNWNSLREYIEENKKVATEYTRKIELSGLCQGDYPVPYYHAIKRIDLDNLYLDKMNELEGENNDIFKEELVKEVKEEL